MNNCVLMATVEQLPQMRYTSDNQTPVSEFLVQFPDPNPNSDTMETIKAIAWGDRAQEVQNAGLEEGQKVLLEGRIQINKFERPEGFTDKRAEVIISKVHSLGGDTPKAALHVVRPATTTPETLPEPEFDDDGIPF